jgi:hypothetical protein
MKQKEEANKMKKDEEKVEEEVKFSSSGITQEMLKKFLNIK